MSTLSILKFSQIFEYPNHHEHLHHSTKHYSNWNLTVAWENMLVFFVITPTFQKTCPHQLELLGRTIMCEYHCQQTLQYCACLLVPLASTYILKSFYHANSCYSFSIIFLLKNFNFIFLFHNFMVINEYKHFLHLSYLYMCV